MGVSAEVEHFDRTSARELSS